MTSGVAELSIDVGFVIEVREGPIIRNQVFPSPDEAAPAA
jgi:hypothetical protein